jgi:hypothetical protein
MQQEAINILPSPAMSSRVNNFIGCKINQRNPKLNKFNFARRETIPVILYSCMATDNFSYTFLLLEHVYQK